MLTLDNGIQQGWPHCYIFAAFPFVFFFFEEEEVNLNVSLKKSNKNLPNNEIYRINIL